MRSRYDSISFSKNEWESNKSPNDKFSEHLPPTAVIAVMKIIQPEFLKVQADRCRKLAANADNFTKERLLRLAEDYEKRWEAQTEKHPANE